MDLDDLRAFIAVADTGSFSAAAKSLNFARNTLRKHVDNLETTSGVQLLKRAADGAAVTRAGDLLAQKGRALLGETRALIEAVRALENLNELLGLDVPVGLPPQFEQMAHKAFRKAAPGLRWRIRYTDGRFNPDSEATFVVFIGKKPATDPRWQKTRVARVRTGLFASEAYLEAHGIPQSVEDVREHRLILWEQPDRDISLLPASATQDHTVALRPSIVSPSGQLVRRLAQSGDGICFAPASKLAGLFGSKDTLVPVLKDIVHGEAEMWMAVRSEVSAGAIGLVANAMRGYARAALSPLE